MESISTIKDNTNDLFIKYANHLGYDEEQIDVYREVLSSVKEIIQRNVTPNHMDWDKIGAQLVNGKVKLPTNMENTIQEIIRENQLLQWFIPEKYGGYGYGNVFAVGIYELFAQYDISLQILTFISLSVLEALTVYYKDNFQPIIDDFANGKRLGYVAFTEPQAGSNLENIKSTSTLEGDEYILNGTKIFISNGGYADTGLFLARNIVDNKTEGTNVFLIDNMKNITIDRLEEKSGIHANPTAQLTFNDVIVPKENLIGKSGAGYRKVLETLMGMRLGVIWQGIGASQRAFKLAKDYSEQRVQFGKPIISFDGVSRKLKDIEKQLVKFRTYGYVAAYGLDRFYKGYIPVDVGATGEASEKTAADMFPSTVRTGLAHYLMSTGKLYTSEITNMILYDCQQIYGGNGFVYEYEINKIARDVRILPVYEGTSEIHEWLIHKTLPALNMLPKFKKTSLNFNELTVYERMLYEKFPSLRNAI
ncbi:MAG: acyl-CoA dehydrogenase family protein [Candidatus Heimdallarchaeota archaeon]|nr:acyl-CoA dehydrogenase family protein [Candidatus Heimdallarchaeota archaeon]MDH5644437.1 acyl-CoA dehydrogenase family protein [Candidatus Heimdallarchaeota archaeon]